MENKAWGHDEDVQVEDIHSSGTPEPGLRSRKLVFTLVVEAKKENFSRPVGVKPVVLLSRMIRTLRGDGTLCTTQLIASGISLWTQSCLFIEAHIPSCYSS